jgi:hypothetical protein
VVLNCTEETVYLEPGWERRAEPDKEEGRIIEVMDEGTKERESETKEGKPEQDVRKPSWTRYT